MVSILLLTIDRYELTEKYVSLALDRANYPYELLVCDNGSTDKRTIDFISSLKPAAHILNSENKGIYSGLNSLLEKAKGEYFVKIDNDIELPENWLKSFVETYEAIPNAGMAGIHCVHSLPPAKEINGIKVHLNPRTFGTMFWSRALFDKIGYFNEAFTPYGLGDSEYMQRSLYSGHINFYLNGLEAIHQGHDIGEDSDYRRNKTKSLERNEELFYFFLSFYESSKNYYLPKNNREMTINRFERRN